MTNTAIELRFNREFEDLFSKSWIGYYYESWDM